jgi:uncharacterized membrane protein YhaH (DUF805 family)
MFPSSNQHSPIGKGKISISCYINDHLLGKAIVVSFFVAVFCFVLSIMVKKLHAIRLIDQVIFTFFTFILTFLEGANDGNMSYL